MANYLRLKRMVIEEATLIAKAKGVHPIEVLEAMRTKLFSSGIINGKVVISTTEAGGTTTFAFLEGFPYAEVADLIQAAIEDLRGGTPREVRRLRACYNLTSL
jgi:hypothetical protein